MVKAIITVGISASGKSTYANELVASGGWVDCNRDTIRFNKVMPGSDWSSYKFTRARENEVTRIQEELADEAIRKGFNVIISDTNLTKKYLDKWVAFFEERFVDWEIKEFPITLEEAWKRDAYRPNGVGKSVIYAQWEKWLEYTNRKRYIPDESLPEAILFDLDGTLADMRGIRGPFEWDKVGLDKERLLIGDMAEGYCGLDYKIVVLSGRDGVCYDDSLRWLEKANIPFDNLFMRCAGDSRKDTVVKEEIFWNDVAPYYNVVGVVEDRPSVVRLWIDMGIENVICVGNPWKEF